MILIVNSGVSVVFNGWMGMVGQTAHALRGGSLFSSHISLY